jgi:hypothetical protein
MRFGVGLRPERIGLHGAGECNVCGVKPAETDIRVCQRREPRHIGRVESHRTRQRLRRRAEPLRVLMQAPEQRPGFSVGRIGSDCALEVCCGFAGRPSGNEDPGEQFPRVEVVGVFRQQAFEIRACLRVITGLSQRERASFDGVRVGNLRERHPQREKNTESADPEAIAIHSASASAR